MTSVCFSTAVVLKRFVVGSRNECHVRPQKCEISCQGGSGEEKYPLVMENVSYWRPCGRQILDGISLSVKRGELAMLVGHNGCGKSTLLKVVRGIIKPTLGTVHIARPCAFVGQNPSRSIVMPTVGEDIGLFLKLPRDIVQEEAERKIDSCLESVGLVPAEKFRDMQSYRMSGGQRQRAAVASALATKPSVLLMDEVTGSMDLENREALLSKMHDIISSTNAAALWITHHLDELRIADVIYVMRQGRITHRVLGRDLYPPTEVAAEFQRHEDVLV